MNKYSLGYLLLCVLLYACGGERQTDAEARGFNPAEAIDSADSKTDDSEEMGSDSIKVSWLTNEELTINSECGCIFQTDEPAAEEQIVFFSFDKQTPTALISINGSRQKLGRAASLSPQNSTAQSYLHENKYYSVQTSLMEGGKDQNGNTIYAGKVRITDKVSKVKEIIAVRGRCNCD